MGPEANEGMNEMFNERYINTGFWQIINIIRQRNKHAKIFISALLPRPVDNQDVKPLINKFNRAGQEAGSVSAAAYSIA